MIWRVLAGMAIVVSSCLPAPACLTTTLDAKAVQWSTLIVQAKLVAVGAPISLASSGSTTQPSGLGYQTYDLEITLVMDGSAKVGDRIQIIRYLNLDVADATACGQNLGKDQIGKLMVVLARPQGDLQWSNDTAVADPRPQEVKDLKALAVVNLQSASDMGADALADLKGLITDVRADEAQFNSADAQAQAATLAHAADETEAGDAEHTLVQMGPKALPAVRRALHEADKSGQGRLQRVIDEISPPPLSTGTFIPK
jgi:hypothetical protein